MKIFKRKKDKKSETEMAQNNPRNSAKQQQQVKAGQRPAPQQKASNNGARARNGSGNVNGDILLPTDRNTTNNSAMTTPTRGKIAAVATAAAISSPPSAPAPEPSPTTMIPPDQLRESEQATVDLTRDLVKKFIAEIWNRGEIDLIPEVCSSSLRFNGNTGFDRVGHDGLARMVATIRDALDDYHCEIHSMVVENNKAFCRLRFTGKHTGNLLGYPPTGRVVGWMGATEFTCQNGKILKVWELGDIKTLEEQLIVMDQPVEGQEVEQHELVE